MGARTGSSAAVAGLMCTTLYLPAVRECAMLKSCPGQNERLPLEKSMNRIRFTLVAQVALTIHSFSILSYGQTPSPAPKKYAEFQYELGDYPHQHS